MSLLTGLGWTKEPFHEQGNTDLEPRPLPSHLLDPSPFGRPTELHFKNGGVVIPSLQTEISAA